MIAIYARVSTEEQIKGYSIESQIEECLKLAEGEKVEIYVDCGFTGEILNRPNLSKLISEIEQGRIKQLICYDPDRLSRKLLNQLLLTEIFTKHNVKLSFVRSNYEADAEGQLYFQIRGAFSEFDKAKIKHNTMMGKYRKAKQGYVVKNSRLYGYDYCREKQSYIVNEEQASIVRLIFDLFTKKSYEFQGINGIATYLTDLHIPTARGAKVWHRQVVRQILMNEAYTGVYYQNKFDTEGNYVKRQAGEPYQTGRMRPKNEWLRTSIPALITKEQFHLTQKRLMEVRRRFAGRKRHLYLLSGLVHCGRCNGRMIGRKHTSRGKAYYIYYCPKKTDPIVGCGRMMSEKKLNQLIWSNVLFFLKSREYLQLKNLKKEEEQALFEIKSLNEQIRIKEKGFDRLVNLFINQDKNTSEKIEEKINNLQEEIKELRNVLSQKRIQFEEISKLAIDNAGKEAEAIHYLLKGKLLKREKQQLIRILIKEIKIINHKEVKIITF